MEKASTHIRRVPEIDLKQQINALLQSPTVNAVEKDYTGKVTLTLNYHRGSLNTAHLDKTIAL